MRADEELYSAYQHRGDTAALSELITRHERRLMAFLSGMLSAAEAEDAFQEVWYRLVSKAAAYRGGNFGAYLIIIARRIAVDRLRKVRPTVALDAEAAEGEALVERLPASTPSPSEHLSHQDAADLLKAALRRLPPGPRQVVLMRLEGELPFKVIASELKVPLGTALNWMHAATLALSKCLAG